MTVQQLAPDDSPTTVWSDADPSVSVFGADVVERVRELSAVAPVTRFTGGVLVTDPAAAEKVMRDAATFSSKPDAFFLGSDGGLIPIQVDPPEHTRYRRVLDRFFAPRVVTQLAGEVTRSAAARIEALAAGGRCDVVADLGVPVPGETILAMLGFPLDRLPELLTVKDDILRPPTAAEDPVAQKTGAARRAYAFFGTVLEARAADPAEDLATHLVEQEAAGLLTRQESLDICLMMVIAGLDTVTATAANVFALLARRPDLQARLAAEPGIVPAAVEEFLRLVSPVPITPRIATTDTEVGGCPIRKGDRLTVMFTATNWDEAAFPAPLEIDFDRPVNRHTAFGLGRHRCLGSHLARMELQVLLREWHARIPAYRLPEGHEVRWRRGIREIAELPLEF